MRNIFCGAPLFVVMLTASGGLAIAEETLQSCAAKPQAERLACYDALAEATVSETTVTPTKSEWRVRTDVSPVDDSKNVFLSVTGGNGITDRYGRDSEMTLVIACRENTTSAWVNFGGHFMSDIQGAGRVTYRVDSKPAQTKSFGESSNHEALGLWNGGTAIPWVKSLFGGDRLYLEAMPYSESKVHDFFPIAGLEEAIAPLRESCGW